MPRAPAGQFCKAGTGYFFSGAWLVLLPIVFKLNSPHMKSCLSLLLFMLIGINLLGQPSFDLKEIEDLTTDPGADPSYSVLVEIFNNSPSALNVHEGKLIYYGRLFAPNYKPYKLNFDEMDFTKLVGGKKYKKAVTKGEDLLKAAPANLEVLARLFTCYNKLGLQDKANLTKAKIDLLVSSILAQGSGQSKDNTIKVVSVGDEYVMIGVLGFSGTRQNSSITGVSILDTWKVKDPKGNRRDLYVEVLVNQKGAP